LLSSYAKPEQKTLLNGLEIGTFTQPDVPTQQNGFDCGVYICLFALCWVRKQKHGWITENSSKKNRHYIEQVVLSNVWPSYSTQRKTDILLKASKPKQTEKQLEKPIAEIIEKVLSDLETHEPTKEPLGAEKNF
jgi:hypothetical protein